MAYTRTMDLIMLWAHQLDQLGYYPDDGHPSRVDSGWKTSGRKDQGFMYQVQIPAKKFLGQEMAPLPRQLTIPCLVWTNVGLDLKGPFVVEKMGSGKTTKGNVGTFKCWGLIILCINTKSKAVKLFVVCGYSTEEFMLAYEQFTSDHGHPVYVHYDWGSQLCLGSQGGVLARL